MINSVVSFKLYRASDFKTKIKNMVGLGENSDRVKIVYKHNSITQRLESELKHNQVDFT